MEDQELLKMIQDKAREVLMSDEEFDKLLEEAEEIARDSANRQSSMMPKILVHTTRDEKGKRDLHVVVIASMEDDKKYETLASIGAKMGSEGVRVTAVFFLSEAWSKESMTVEDIQKIKQHNLSLADDPDRKESIIVMGGTLDRRMNNVSIEVKRNKRNKMILKETKWVKASEPSNISLDSDLIKAFYRGYVLSKTKLEAAG